MFIDYHFHPNFTGKRRARRSRRLWRAFAKNNLGAIICTEHTFKDAAQSYRTLLKYKPSDATTHLFPGAELTTKDGSGVDIIAFSDEDWYDRHPALLKPFSMTLPEMIGYLERSDLQWFVPHPFLPSNPLRRYCRSEAELKSFLSSVPGFELLNGCAIPLEHVLSRLPFRRVSTHLQKALRYRAHVPPHITPVGTAKFVAVGSDAHHPRSLGVAIEIHCPDNASKTQVFTKMTHNTDVSRIRVPVPHGSLRCLLQNTLITWNEFWMRWLLKFRLKLQSLWFSERSQENAEESEIHEVYAVETLGNTRDE